MYKKLVIVFEGIEGSGKTFHINKLENYLRKNKLQYVKIREPGGNPNSEKIRKLILNKNSNFNPYTDLLLYQAARSENIATLKKFYRKKIILIDRFIDSTIAYQHYGFNIDINLINSINKSLLKGFKIDLTFLNIVNQKNLTKRLKFRKKLNRYDQFSKNFYKKVQAGFLKLSMNKNKKYKVINSNLDIKTNQKLILKQVEKLLR